MPSFSIVIPTYQRGDLLRACLTSVAMHAPADTEVVVVDDASPNGIGPNVVDAFPGVRLVRLDKRRGFAAAANAGIRASRGEIVELLNDDTEVEAAWAQAALRHFDNPEIGAVAPLVLDWRRRNRIDSAGDRYYLGGVARKRGHGAAPGAEYQEARPVFGASASSAFYRREALCAVGLFPESFGSYFEDVDLAFRLQRAGYRARYEPRSRVLHHGGASHGKPNASLVARQSLNEERVFWRNIPRGEMRHALPRHAAVLLGKAWRRWREGTFGAFLAGRLRILAELPELLRHRRALNCIGDGQDFANWGVEQSWR